MTETADPDFGPEAYKTHSAGCACPDCAGDRQFARLRDEADQLVAATDKVEHLLACLVVSLDEVTSNYFYGEFYRLTMDDEDAAAFLTEARRAVRSFARIARERAARTRQDP